MKEPLIIKIQDLTTVFKTEMGTVKAVDRLHLDVPQGLTLGIVGESGCGKSTVGLSIMQLIPNPPGKICDGSILFEGQDLIKLDNGAIRKIRGNRISMIFQEPMTSLNPVRRAGDIITEVIALHRKVSHKIARKKAIELLDLVRISSPEIRIDDYPHELSGGMRQRFMIAMAISCDPALIIADEPTTALDVTIQAQILALLNRIKKDLGTSIILITHDLGVIAENTEITAVMYAGQLVEYASTADLFNHPLHPYTQGLMKSVPRLNAGKEKKRTRLSVIPGSVPSLLTSVPGCRFARRCSQTMDKCFEKDPMILEHTPTHLVKCWRYT